MANKNNKNLIKDERIEDTTLYGEFVPSFDQWVTPDRQKNVARHLAGATDGKPKEDLLQSKQVEQEKNQEKNQENSLS